MVIIGAGWSGMNAARILGESGHEVKVLEKSDRVGGRITSEYFDGFTLDRGFQVINPAYAELRETGVLENLHLFPLPKGLDIRDELQTIRVGDVRSNLSYLRGAIDKRSGTLREKIAFLRYLKQSKDDSSFESALKDSGRLFDYVLKPFFDGVFLTDSRQVSNRMARELIHWFIKGKPGLPEGGVRAVSEEMAAGLEIEFNCEVSEIKEHELVTSLGREPFDELIIAADPQGASQLLGIQPLRMNYSATWYFSAPKSAVTSDHLRIGGVGPIINSLAVSNVAASYAPRDQMLIQATSLLPTTEVDVRSHLTYLWETEVSNFDLIERFEIPSSLPFHQTGKALIEPVKIRDHVYLAGDWRATPSQQGALLSGRRAALCITSGQ